MPIDFHAESNRFTYARRQADASWIAAIQEIIDPLQAYQNLPSSYKSVNITNVLIFIAKTLDKFTITC